MSPKQKKEPSGARTRNLPIRSRVPYPIEPPAQTQTENYLSSSVKNTKMAGKMTPVATSMVKFMTDKGYKEVKQEDCDILNKKYVLEQTIQLYIDEQGVIKHVNSIRFGDKLDKTGKLELYVSYKLNNIIGEDKRVEKDDSVCTIFQAIAGSPNQSTESFRGALTMWKKSGFFGGDTAALVYSSPDGPTVAGTGHQFTKLEGARDDINGKAKYLGAGFATVLILSVLGLSLAFYLKNRNKRREEEEELSRPD